MTSLYDRTAPKKATNLSLNNHLLTQAKRLNINVSATCEAALEAAVRQAAREQWLKDNQTALDHCNTLTETHGLFADKHRGF